MAAEATAAAERAAAAEAAEAEAAAAEAAAAERAAAATPPPTQLQHKHPSYGRNSANNSLPGLMIK